MMNRYKGLILFFILMAAVTGWAQTSYAFGGESIYMFNREYYAVKDLTTEDIWKLKEIANSDDVGAVKSAGLILGRYYVRKGDIGKGRELIKNNLDDSYLDKFMKTSGHLWAYDADLKMGDTESAEKEREILLGIEMDDKAAKAFKVYCLQENINYTTDPRECIQADRPKGELLGLPAPKAMEMPPAVLPPAPAKAPVNVKDADLVKPDDQADSQENDAAPQPEPKAAVPSPKPIMTDIPMPAPKPAPVAIPVPVPTPAPASAKAAEPEQKADINADQQSADSDDGSAAVVDEQSDKEAPAQNGAKAYNTGRKIAGIRVDNSVNNPDIVEAMLYGISKMKLNLDLDFEGDKPSYDYIVDASQRTVNQGDDTVDFSLDQKEVMKKAIIMAIQSGSNSIALGYSYGLRDEATELVEEYRQKVQFFLFNIQDKDFQNKLKDIRAKAGNRNVSYVVAGTQEKVLKVMPFLRYYAPRPDKAVVVAALDCVGTRFYSGDYADYARNAIIVTDMMLNDGGALEQFSKSFTADFGKQPESSDMIGYDMLIYMEKKRNTGFSAGYLSGITKIVDGSVDRTPSAYRVIGNGRLKKMD